MSRWTVTPILTKGVHFKFTFTSESGLWFHGYFFRVRSILMLAIEIQIKMYWMKEKSTQCKLIPFLSDSLLRRMTSQVTFNIYCSPRNLKPVHLLFSHLGQYRWVLHFWWQNLNKDNKLWATQIWSLMNKNLISRWLEWVWGVFSARSRGVSAYFMSWITLYVCWTR